MKPTNIGEFIIKSILVRSQQESEELQTLKTEIAALKTIIQKNSCADCREFGNADSFGHDQCDYCKDKYCYGCAPEFVTTDIAIPYLETTLICPKCLKIRCSNCYELPQNEKIGLLTCKACYKLMCEKCCKTYKCLCGIEKPYCSNTCFIKNTDLTDCQCGTVLCTHTENIAWIKCCDSNCRARICIECFGKQKIYCKSCLL